MASIKQILVGVGPVIVTAVLGVVVSHLKTQTVTQFLCEDIAICPSSMATSCEVCTSKFKNCRGFQIYEPFTVVLFESFLTIVIGSCVSLLTSSNVAETVAFLFDLSAMKTFGLVGGLYALGDFADMLAAGKVTGTTLLVATQFRLPLCALLRIAVLGKGQTLQQWFFLFVIFCLCLVHLMSEVSPDPQKQSKPDDSFLWILFLCSGKSIISVGSAIQAEVIYGWSGKKITNSKKDAKETPAIIKQVHFKAATLLAGLVFGYFAQGRRGGRILATEWRIGLFDRLPPGVKYGDSRTPFFGGWDASTWTLVACLVINNFIMGFMLRYLTSVSKYTAGGFALVLSYCGQLWQGSKLFEYLPALCCVSIAYCTVHYSGLEEQQKALAKQSAAEEKANGGKTD